MRRAGRAEKSCYMEYWRVGTIRVLIIIHLSSLFHPEPFQRNKISPQPLKRTCEDALVRASAWLESLTQSVVRRRTSFRSSSFSRHSPRIHCNATCVSTVALHCPKSGRGPLTASLDDLDVILAMACTEETPLHCVAFQTCKSRS